MRIRTIKPSFWTNDELAELHPLTRLLFIGLWCLADVRGRLEDRPKRIKAAVLPYDDHDVDDALDDLARAGFLIRYTVNGVDCVQVTNFEKHQRINGKEAETESDFPGCDQDGAEIRLGKQRGSNGEAPGSPEGKGREGREEEGKRKDGAKAPRFSPPTREELDLEAAKIGLPSIEVDKFVGYYGSNGWRVGKNQMKSWPHALANWAARWRENAHGHQNRSFGGNGQPSAADQRRALVAGADDTQRQAEESARRDRELVQSGKLPF